jgi:uncharacterized protein
MTMTPRAAFAAAIGIVLMASPAIPLLAPPAQAQAPSAEALKAAAAVVDLQTPPDRTKALLETQLKELRSGAGIRAMLGNNPQFRMEAAKNQPSFNAAIGRMGAMQADALGPILREMQPATRQAMIDAYARAYTVAELNDIAAFYRSPTGTKLRATQGQTNAAANKVIQERFGPRMQAAEKAIAPKLNAELKKLMPPQAPAK